jgi:hypothetical protein
MRPSQTFLKIWGLEPRRASSSDSDTRIDARVMNDAGSTAWPSLMTRTIGAKGSEDARGGRWNGFVMVEGMMGFAER